MKRFAVSLFIIIALIVFTASGAIQLQPEHQAYVMFLGAELQSDGQIHLSALCPKIAGDTKAEYQLFESSGSSISTAFLQLERSIPRNVVFVQLKALLLTPDFADSMHMGELIYYLLLGAEYYSDAWVLVGGESPAGFLADYKPAIGTRLSASIQATMADAADLNMIPDTHLADLLDGWHGLYSDVPVIAYTVERFGDKASVHPEGTQLFAGQRLSIALDAEETALLNWLRGDVRTFTLTDAGNALLLTPELPPKVIFDHRNNKIRISGHFVQHRGADGMLRSQVQYLLEERIEQLLRKCRDAGSEPFRFAEYAAAEHATIAGFIAQDFDSFYAGADFAMHARVRDELT